MKLVLLYALAVPAVMLGLGGYLALVRHPHWFIRGWDFPKVQLAITLLVLLAAFSCVWLGWPVDWSAWGPGLLRRPAPGWLLPTVIVSTVPAVLWHAYRVWVYTALYPFRSATYRSGEPGPVRSLHGEVEPPGHIPDSRAHRDPRSLRVVVSNVQMENREFERWFQTIDAEQPDVIIAVETDSAWTEALESLAVDYPHRVMLPQENWYGMVLLSRLELIESQVRNLVQSDIPSIHARVRLPSGHAVRIAGVHPRPPEPIRDMPSSHRDAELMIVAKILSDAPMPSIVGGDLNDVAWSHSTRLFLRLSGLIDPRRGRGFFNTFHAGHWWMRFPLDHIFHSPEFALREIRRLPAVGSDHFPMLIDLVLQPDAIAEQPIEEIEEGDRDDAEQIIETEEELENVSLSANRDVLPARL